MKKVEKKVKPIAQLLIPFYFFPLVFSSIFSNSHEGASVFFAATIVLCSLSCLLLYFTFKYWEADWQRAVSLHPEVNVQEKAAVVEYSYKANEDMANIQILEDTIRQKDEVLTSISNENQDFKIKIQNQDDKIADLTNSLFVKDKKMKEIEGLFHEQNRKNSINEDQIAVLKAEIAHLNFELRTLFKLDQKSPFTNMFDEKKTDIQKQ